jgi:hypothetical protein
LDSKDCGTSIGPRGYEAKMARNAVHEKGGFHHALSTHEGQ